MDPWDIDISLLAKRYLNTIRKLKEMNFFISGKILLASAILLKIKSTKLLTEGIAEFDSQLFETNEDLLKEEPEKFIVDREEAPKLLVKTPQARKRKITLNDLMEALQKALLVNERRSFRKLREKEIEKAEIPEKKIDITILIKNLYKKIKEFFSRKEKLTFSKLVGSDRKEDKIYTFIPLLHLTDQGKVDLEQKEHFGEIIINEVR